jgi:acetoin utilization deacetylase AcuC-like enzyme
MGFCLFNNVALMARHAQALGRTRVLIVDFDVHHGNGTQDAFYADPSVLFISTHQWGIYPGTGAAEETGHGAGRGATLNIPLPAGAGDAAFERLANDLWLPAAARFKPDFLLVSAGFDAHWADPLAGLQLSHAGYAQLTRVLTTIAAEHCQGQLALALEGGYHLTALAHGVLTVLRGLTNAPAAPSPLGPAPAPEPNLADQVRRWQRQHGL